MNDQQPAAGNSASSSSLAGVPRLSAGWPALFETERRPALAALLLEFARARRWFRAKNRDAGDARIVDLLSLTDQPLKQASDVLVMLEVSFSSGAPELYVIPLTTTDASHAVRLAVEAPHALVAVLGDAAILIDGLATGGAATLLARLARAGAMRAGQVGRLRGHPQPAFGQLAEGLLQAPQIAKGEQTNSTVSFGERVLLKVYRQLTAGPNPELEIGLFLDEKIGTTTASRRGPPPILAALSYEGADGAVYSLGIAHRYLANQGDAWSLAQHELREYFERAGRLAPSNDLSPGRFAGLAETLGRRTGELHLALARADADDPAFAVEPLTTQDRVAAAERASAMLAEQLTALRARLDRLSAEARAVAESLLAPDSRERRGLQALLTRFGREPLKVVKTRIHGDLHLGQVLFHGDDFTIIDFEGEPARPLAERRAKSSPLRDVMGMVRSFSYAPEAVLRADTGPASRRTALAAAATRWQGAVKTSYLRGYRTTVGSAPFLPASTDPGQLELMLAFYELERVIYEVGYELNNRTDWVDIPLGGLREIALRSAQTDGQAQERA